jgi:chromosome segregation ATPase
MSRNTLIVAVLALILAIGALIVQFVLPSGGGSDTAALDALRADVTQLKQAGASQSLKVAYLDAEQAFGVFLQAVADLRQQITTKSNEITELKSNYAQGIVSAADYERRFYQLTAEQLDARVTTAAGTLDRMIASSKFADLRSQLITLREEAQPLVNEVNNLVSTISVGAIDVTEFQNRYGTLETLFNQFDGYVTSAATMKLVSAAEKVATAYGYDLVILKKDVIVYRNAATITDITDLVKSEIQTYL